ncbi:hypothetical protein AAG906_028937 [Vitis piasezkii]
MPSTAATAYHSSPCFSLQSPSSLPSNSHQPNNPLTSKPKNVLQKHPLYTPAHSNLSLQFKEKILCLEIMGVDSGIHQKDLGRIFGMCPKLLTSNIRTDLIPVFNFLSQDLKVPDQSFRRVINKCPRLLVSSVRDQLKPALIFLQRLGFQDLEALAHQDPVLLVSSVEKTLIPKLEYLVSLGMSRADAVGMVLRCPGLFTFSVENNFKPKFEYFEFPQYFAFSLEKRIKPRHMEAVQNGVKVPLALMLKSTDEEFRELMTRHGVDESGGSYHFSYACFL